MLFNKNCETTNCDCTLCVDEVYSHYMSAFSLYASATLPDLVLVLQVDPVPLCVPYIAVLLLVAVVAVPLLVLLVQATAASWTLIRSS